MTAPADNAARPAHRRRHGSAEERPRGRLARAAPWNVGSLLPWAIVATAGDPLLVLVPAISLAGLIIGVLALGAPVAPDTIVPLVALPPVDAYQDVAVVDHAVDGTIATVFLRATFWVVRILVAGTLVALAVERVRGGVPELAAAFRRVRARVSTLAFLELVGFSAFGSTLVLRAGLADARTDGSVTAGLLVGLLFLPNALVAAVADDLAAGSALRRSFAWARHKPLGHVLVVFSYAAALNGLGSLAAAGETGRPSPVALTLIAFAAAALGTVFLVALARRYELLYSQRAVAPAVPARPLRELLVGPAPAERTRDRRAARPDR